jgi:hypothetical protein
VGYFCSYNHAWAGQAAQGVGMKIYSIGYQRLPLSRLIEIVRELDALLVDVRLKPYSWNPDYRRANLESFFGKQYTWMGRVLGGFDHVVPEGIAWIKQERKKRTLLLLCVEHNPLNCHRHHAICGPHFQDAIHIVGQDLILACDLETNLR